MNIHIVIHLIIMYLLVGWALTNWREVDENKDYQSALFILSLWPIILITKLISDPKSIFKDED